MTEQTPNHRTSDPADRLMLALNNREIASALWLGVFATWALFQPRVRDSLISAVKTSLHPKILAVFFFMAVYVAGVVWGFYKIGAWTPPLIKGTVIWFLFTGVVSAGRGISSRKAKQEIGALVRDNIKIILVIEVLIGTYTFPLLIEIVLVPVLAVIAVLDVVAESRDEFSSAAKLIEWVQAGLGFLILAGVGIRVFQDFQTVASTDTLQEVLLAPGLAISFIPCVFLLMLYSSYEMLLTRLSIGRDLEPGVKTYAFWRFLKSYKLNPAKIRRITSQYPSELMRVETRGDIDEFVEATCR